MPLIPIFAELLAMLGIGTSLFYGTKYVKAESVLQDNGLSSNNYKPIYKELAKYAAIVLLIYGVVRVAINLTKK